MHKSFHHSVNPFYFHKRGADIHEADEWNIFDSEFTGRNWEAEASRNSSEYVRWVQQSLNQILGLRLAVDGIAGPMTHSAIRSFQQSRGLTVDGIVGPITEAALVAALGGQPTTSDTDVIQGGPPISGELTVIREHAGSLIAEYVPSDFGDSKFSEIILRDFSPGFGTTCGFLCHWLLWRLGCTNHEIINRSAPGFPTYRPGANISRLYQGGKPPFIRTVNATAIRDGLRPQLGDIVFIKTDPNNRTGAGEHVCVFLEETTENGRIVWKSADAGQKNSAGQECARFVTREFIPFGSGGKLRRDGFDRVIMGWLSLANLNFGPPPVANASVQREFSLTGRRAARRGTRSVSKLSPRLLAQFKASKAMQANTPKLNLQPKCSPNPIGRRCSFEEMWNLIQCHYVRDFPLLCKLCEPEITSIFSPELLIAIFWEETRFENIKQAGGGPAVGFGQVEPPGVRAACEFCGINPAWKPTDISPHVDDAKAVQIAGMYLHRQFCVSKASTKEAKKLFALRSYVGWFAKGDWFKGSLAEWQRQRQAIIDGWLECEKYLKSRNQPGVTRDREFFVTALIKATKGKPAQRYKSDLDDQHVFPNGALPKLAA